ncbi:MAG: PEP-CTERM sorting domain-containing protein [Caulobacterales bacterium]|nr:PEP-CTERM sorting domain-containing protein [Caulobacterales bacterium]
MRSLWTSISAITAAAALASVAAPASAASTLDVNWNSGCGKASCFNDKGVFTQTWSSADAHGPMTIGQFLLDRGVLGSLDGQTFSISFSIGGQDVGSWGKYNMGGIGGDELNFSGENFLWNPEDGDLVLTLSIIEPPKGGFGGGGGFFFAPLGETQGDQGPPGGDPPPGDGDPGQGGFGGSDNTSINLPESQTPVSAAPEPVTWALMIGGFGLAGSALRRRRVQAA